MEALAQLSRIGNNLNQLARQVNTNTGAPARTLLDQVQVEAWLLRDQLNTISRELEVEIK